MQPTAGIRLAVRARGGKPTCPALELQAPLGIAQPFEFVLKKALRGLLPRHAGQGLAAPQRSARFPSPMAVILGQ